MRQSLRVAISIAILLAAFGALRARAVGETVPVRKALDHFPMSIGGWQGQEATVLDIEVLNVLKATDYVLRRYVDGDGRSLWLYVAYWGAQRKGAQPHSPKNCLPGNGWEPIEASLVTVPLAGSSIKINRYLIQKEGQQQVVFYWYQSQGKPIATELDAKIALVRNAVIRNRTDGALVRVSSPAYKSAAETSARLVAYVQTMYPLLSDYLPD